MSYAGYGFALPWSSSIPINGFSITEMPAKADMFEYWNTELEFQLEEMAAYEEAGLAEVIPEATFGAADTAFANMIELQSSMAYESGMAYELPVVAQDAWGLPLMATEAGATEVAALEAGAAEMAALEATAVETAVVGAEVGIGAELATVAAVAPLVAAAVIAVAGIGYLIYELVNSGENSDIQKAVNSPNTAIKVGGKYALTPPTYGPEEYVLPVTAKNFFRFPFKYCK